MTHHVVSRGHRLQFAAAMARRGLAPGASLAGSSIGADVRGDGLAVPVVVAAFLDSVPRSSEVRLAGVIDDCGRLGDGVSPRRCSHSRGTQECSRHDFSAAQCRTFTSSTPVA